MGCWGLLRVVVFFFGYLASGSFPKIPENSGQISNNLPKIKMSRPAIFLIFFGGEWNIIPLKLGYVFSESMSRLGRVLHQPEKLTRFRRVNPFRKTIH